MAERSYKIKDGIVLEWADTVISYLKEDIQLFTDFDAKLDQRFITLLESKVTQAYKEGGDQLNIAQLQEKTESVDRAMNDCHAYFKKLRYWVLDAFPDQKAIQKQFGVGRYAIIRRSQIKMIQYTEGLTTTINQHRDALIATGIPAQLLEQPAALSEALRSANNEQEQKKGTRTVDTDQRKELFNELYRILQKINAAADNVFDQHPAKRKLYRTPRVTSSTRSITTNDEEE
ncbi:hypothetical protein [Aquimarina longa]|uniref:hypothetical protein n=1 Tax=Aquimarina longa TaxID=1080221 RepID=UPI0007828FDB|nr:hypothetical protein [Aquimarina longa]